MTYTAITPISGLGNPISTALINTMIGNQAHFRTPPNGQYSRGLALANYTNTTSMADIDGTNLVHTVVTTGNPVMCMLQAGKISGSAASDLVIDLLVDGVSQSSVAGGVWVMHVTGATDFKPVNIAIPIFNLSAASHVFRWQWKTSSGTITLFSANLIQSWIREM